MATPAYQGQGQPVADNGGSWFGRLGSFLGGGTPSYAGVGQPTSGGNGYLGGSSVAYAPATSTTAPADGSNDGPSEAEAMTCPIDPEALAAGHIAIVIPRERLAP